MKRQKLPLLYHWITGAIGKEFVIKQYKYGTVKTKYPDMTKIIASKAQRNCRNRFRDAVAYAKKIMADPVQKEAWLKRARQKSKVFIMIVRHYLLELKEQAVKRRNATKRLIQACFTGKINRNEIPVKQGELTDDNTSFFLAAMLSSKEKVHSSLVALRI